MGNRHECATKSRLDAGYDKPLLDFDVIPNVITEANNHVTMRKAMLIRLISIVNYKKTAL